MVETYLILSPKKHPQIAEAASTTLRKQNSVLTQVTISRLRWTGWRQRIRPTEGIPLRTLLSISTDASISGDIQHKNLFWNIACWLLHWDFSSWFHSYWSLWSATLRLCHGHLWLSSRKITNSKKTVYWRRGVPKDFSWTCSSRPALEQDKSLSPMTLNTGDKLNKEILMLVQSDTESCRIDTKAKSWKKINS